MWKLDDPNRWIVLFIIDIDTIHNIDPKDLLTGLLAGAETYGEYMYIKLNSNHTQIRFFFKKKTSHPQEEIKSLFKNSFEHLDEKIINNLCSKIYPITDFINENIGVTHKKPYVDRHSLIEESDKNLFIIEVPKDWKIPDY